MHFCLRVTANNVTLKVVYLLDYSFTSKIHIQGGGVEVEWKSTKIKTTCRLGWEGKVCVCVHVHLCMCIHSALLHMRMCPCVRVHACVFVHVFHFFGYYSPHQVDVNCIFPSSGGYYYPDHLPMLGIIMQSYIGVS